MQKGLLSGMPLRVLSAPFSILHANLTLAGWERYESEKRGKLTGSYGFIALKFSDSTLDPFVREVVKPSIKAELGFDVIDMRDVSRAGVIDNIMRAQIRDAAFVLVDFTHDNFGAYWEAGYAEGLGKPVVYLCERAKFDKAKTHFDTNHCTTVL
jgi:nucleoside 2-deoxyribosyltransferase